MSKHTPGPWWFDGTDINSKDGTEVCSLNYGEVTEMVEADARLIASAPDMCALLERLLNECANGQLDLSTSMINEIEAILLRAGRE